MLAAENAQKFGGKILEIFKTIQPSHGVNGLARNWKKPSPPTLWVRVE